MQEEDGKDWMGMELKEVSEAQWKRWEYKQEERERMIDGRNFGGCRLKWEQRRRRTEEEERKAEESQGEMGIEELEGGGKDNKEGAGWVK